MKRGQKVNKIAFFICGIIGLYIISQGDLMLGGINLILAAINIYPAFIMKIDEE